MRDPLPKVMTAALRRGAVAIALAMAGAVAVPSLAPAASDSTEAGPAPQANINPEQSAVTRAVSLGPGRTRLDVRVPHTRTSSETSVSAWWFAAVSGTGAFHLVAVTPTRELTPGVTYATTTIDPPSAHFQYRVCLNPPRELAKTATLPHGTCPKHTGSTPRELELEGEGAGVPLPAYPSAAAISAATRFLEGRAGRTSFAVLDSTGHLSGLRAYEHVETASVVKVMMLVAYLRMLNSEHRGLQSSDTALLYPMIHISDNEAASAVLARVGEPALELLARETGMADYAPGVGWWAYTQTSAADQVRFFAALEQLIPPQFYGYARSLLAGIEPEQSWGIPPVARPTWRVYFKTGALPSQGLFNEVARLERGDVTFMVAVFTDGDPSMAYGEETIAGVAAALLQHTP